MSEKKELPPVVIPPHTPGDVTSWAGPTSVWANVNPTTVWANVKGGSVPISVDAIARHEHTDTTTEAATASPCLNELVTSIAQGVAETVLTPEQPTASLSASRSPTSVNEPSRSLNAIPCDTTALSDAELEEIRERNTQRMRIAGNVFVPVTDPDIAKLLAHIASLQHQITALGPTLDEDELRRGTPDTPERIETIRRADAIHARNQARALHRETEES